MYDLLKQRPALDTNIDGKIFKRFYWLKSELSDFCKRNGLCSYGPKAELSERISYYPDTGNVRAIKPARKKARQSCDRLSLRSIIEDNFVYTEKHRTFFLMHIGKSFVFTAAFRNWLENNAGKRYNSAVKAYRRLRAQKSPRKEVPNEGFEYNAYIGAFFADNEGKTLGDAIKCWEYKKSLIGHNGYERSDLIVLHL